MQSKKEMFKHYINKNIDSAYRLAFVHAKNKEDAEDIVIESVVRALSSVHNLREPKFMSTWFYRIIINTSNTYLKNKNRVVPIDNIREDEGAYDKYKNTDLYDAVMNLDEKYRVIVVLRYFEDMKIEDICKVLGENMNTVKTRLYRAIEKLRKVIGEERISEDGL